MSNLGWYQILTTSAKKVEEPKQLIGLLIGGGALLGGGAVAAVSALKKKITSELEKKRNTEKAAVIYTVYVEGTSNEGLHFKVGDQFKVLDNDGDAGLVEILGDNNSPYFVSLKFLSSISDYKQT